MLLRNLSGSFPKKEVICIERIQLKPCFEGCLNITMQRYVEYIHYNPAFLLDYPFLIQCINRELVADFALYKLSIIIIIIIIHTVLVFNYSVSLNFEIWVWKNFDNYSEKRRLKLSFYYSMHYIWRVHNFSSLIWDCR